MKIEIRWIDGGRHASHDDDRRAAEAARAVFEAAQVDPLEAAEAHAYIIEQAPCSQDDNLISLARVWEDAVCAANVAATMGWHDPNGGAVDLIVYRA
jgi:hypothetical protein